VIVAGDHLERGEVRFRDGSTRIAVDLADFQVVEAALHGHVERSRIELHAAVLGFRKIAL
jgi:hypothetical protein